MSRELLFAEDIHGDDGPEPGGEHVGHLEAGRYAHLALWPGEVTAAHQIMVE